MGSSSTTRCGRPTEPRRSWAPGAAALGIADRVALAHGDVAALGRLLCALADEAEQVGQLLGRAASRPAEAPERARHQLLGGLRDVLVGSHDTPTLIIVEDLHWLDPSTLDLIALIIRDVAHRRCSW